MPLKEHRTFHSNPGQTQIDHVPDRMLLQWHITERCNLRCDHCYQENLTLPDPAWNEMLSALEQFKSFIHYYREQHGGKRFRAHITVTGGEPFVREDFMALLEKLSAGERLFSFAVLTNGTMLTSAVAHSLRLLKPGFVQVSIDGIRETHDCIRGAGSYESAVEGLKLLVRERIPTHISFTAHSGNFREFPHVARLGRQLGVTRVWSDRRVPCGRGGFSKDRVLSPAETREFFGLMSKETQRGWLLRSPVALHRSLQFMVTGDRPYQCSAGDKLVTVLPNGDVCPCRRMPLVVGNIFKEPLEYIYATSPLFRDLRDRERISRGCEGCFFARTCRGGSRCLACAVHGDPFHADPGCWLSTSREENCWYDDRQGIRNDLVNI
jgi:radical SAM protein with 4Fe4S-binding SPASM domain